MIPLNVQSNLLVIVGYQQNTLTDQLAHQLSQQLAIPVHATYFETLSPSISESIQTAVGQAQAQHVIVIPLLYGVSVVKRNNIKLIMGAVQDLWTDIFLYYDESLIDTAYINPLSVLVDRIETTYRQALVTLSQEISANHGVVRVSHSHGTNGVHGHGVTTILPPRYQDNPDINANPMGSADLIYDANGLVAWDEIWTNFCDLALAGGPPHRGTLLEPVNPETIASDPVAYQRVVAELARGIQLITQLPVLTQHSLGWIGIQCTDEAMAIWLLRAIIVENVSVRREKNILFLPAGAHFRLEHEIKNVITVIAKTHHYWQEHIQTLSG